MRVYLVRYIRWMTFRDIWNLKTDMHDHVRVYNCARACLPTQAKINPQNQPKHHSPRTTKGNCLLDGFATCHGNTEAQLKMTVKEYTIYCAYMLKNHIWTILLDTDLEAVNRLQFRAIAEMRVLIMPASQEHPLEIETWYRVFPLCLSSLIRNRLNAYSSRDPPPRPGAGEIPVAYHDTNRYQIEPWARMEACHRGS